MNLYLGQDKVEESVSLLLFFETGMSSLSSPWVQMSLVLQAHCQGAFSDSPGTQISASSGQCHTTKLSLTLILPLKPISECGSVLHSWEPWGCASPAQHPAWSVY